MTTPPPHPLIQRLHSHLDLPDDIDWYEHPADYAEGFFRRGRPKGDELRYWQENGEVKGIAIRGLQVGKSDWLQWPELAALEDLLLIDTRGVRHIKLPPTVKRL
ncbi:MAG: hypothetical protein AAFQ01_05295, partial [Bacteroidota bacterium]